MYRGYEQHICNAGHRFEKDHASIAISCVCGEKSVFANIVDNTNGEMVGIIPHWEWLKLAQIPDKYNKCNLGHMHIVKGTYSVPENATKLRYRLSMKGLVRLYDGKIFDPDGKEISDSEKNRDSFFRNLFQRR